MKVLRIRGRNAQEALAEARRQLGNNVTVLHTKQYEDTALLGLSRRPVVEILAAADTGVEFVQSVTAVSKESASEADLRSVARQISDIRNVLARFESDREPSAQRSQVLDRLAGNGVSEHVAEALISQAKSEDSDKIIALISRRIKTSGPVECDKAQARVALVGPTGAGKTTTAAKLAAQYTLVHKKRVALLTLDTYRVGAVEQLATYARILDIPLEVGMCPEDVAALVQKHQDKDVIVIDTVGRSQRDKAHLNELDRLLRPACPTETHLTVSAQASPAAQKEALDSFGGLRVDRVILTKLDECPQLGCIVDIAASGLLPFSYITYGQEVPDDMAVADEAQLARLVWEGTL